MRDVNRYSKRSCSRIVRLSAVFSIPFPLDQVKSVELCQNLVHFVLVRMSTTKTPTARGTAQERHRG